MKKCKLTKNLTYIAISIFSIIALSSVLFDMSKANPDYICIKSVENQPCNIENCDDREQNGTRKCYGKITTQVYYYLIRTTCEDGYTQKAENRNVGGSSGRQRASDAVYTSESCTITEQDHLAPVGTGKIDYK